MTTVLAVVATGVFVYIAVGFLLHRPPLQRPLSGDPTKPKAHKPTRLQQRQQWLVQANANITARQFYAASVAAGVGSTLALVAATGTPAAAIVPGVAFGSLPYVYFARRRAKRLNAIQQAWPEGIREINAALGSGRTLRRGIVALAQSGPDALRDAFERFPTQSALQGVVPALESVRRNIADPTTDRVIEILIIAHERGGASAQTVLQSLASTTRKDLAVLEQLETQGLEQKINARAVMAMPWLVLAALVLGDGPYREFYQSFLGVVVVIIGVGLCGVGLIIIRRLSRIDQEERVFTDSPVRDRRLAQTLNDNVGAQADEEVPA